MKPCRVKHKTATTAANCPDCRTPTTKATRQSPFVASPLPPTLSSEKDVLTETQRRDDGSISSKFYASKATGRSHRDDGPAKIWYYEDGSPLTEEYYCEGERHRVGDPAEIDYHEDGSPKWEAYRVHGKLHRVGGPAQRGWHKDGSVERETYYEDGTQTREDGPAEIRYRIDGTLEFERYFRAGHMIEREEAVRHYLAAVFPSFSSDNAAVAEWLAPHVEQDPETRAFMSPDSNLVEAALQMFENPAPSAE